MKKLLSILVLSLLFGGSAFAEVITFSKCAHERYDFKFPSNIYEKVVRIIDTDKKIVSKIVIFTDEHVKKTNEEHPEVEQGKYYFGESKIHSFNEFVVKTKYKTEINNVKDIQETIYDLKSKKIQVTHSIYRDGTHSQTNITYLQCQ